MSVEQIPAEVRRFVLTSIPSVPYLEAVLLLRSDPREWDSWTLSRRLYVPEAKAMELLRALQEAGIAVRPEGASGYRYAPATPELRTMIERVEQLYATRLLEITSLIHTRMDKRAMQFADAFRWKKES